MDDPLPLLAPETFVGVARQAKVEFDNEEDKAILVCVPEQMEEESGTAVATGFGFTVTTEETTGPKQPAKRERIL